MTTALCFGTFDGLHPGHEYYFTQARALADRVVVVVARDETVYIVKGRRPDRNQVERLQAVAACPLVDEARLGYQGDKYRIIEELKPNVILLGYDQEAFTEQLEEQLRARGLAVEIKRAEPFQPHLYKSSLLRSQAAQVLSEPS